MDRYIAISVPLHQRSGYELIDMVDCLRGSGHEKGNRNGMQTPLHEQVVIKVPLMIFSLMNS